MSLGVHPVSRFPINIVVELFILGSTIKEVALDIEIDDNETR